MTNNKIIEIPVQSGDLTIVAFLVAGMCFLGKRARELAGVACEIVTWHPQVVVSEQDADTLLIALRGYGALPMGGEGNTQYEIGVIRCTGGRFHAFTRDFFPTAGLNFSGSFNHPKDAVTALVETYAN